MNPFAEVNASAVCIFHFDKPRHIGRRRAIENNVDEGAALPIYADPLRRKAIITLSQADFQRDVALWDCRRTAAIR